MYISAPTAGVGSVRRKVPSRAARAVVVARIIGHARAAKYILECDPPGTYSYLVVVMQFDAICHMCPRRIYICPRHRARACRHNEEAPAARSGRAPEWKRPATSYVPKASRSVGVGLACLTAPGKDCSS